MTSLRKGRVSLVESEKSQDFFKDYGLFLVFQLQIDRDEKIRLRLLKIVFVQFLVLRLFEHLTMFN